MLSNHYDWQYQREEYLEMKNPRIQSTVGGQNGQLSPIKMSIGMINSKL